MIVLAAPGQNETPIGRRHLELLALHDPTRLDVTKLELPEADNMGDALRQIVASRLTERLMHLEPLITLRLRIAVQPAIASLVLAAHEGGTRETGLVEDAAGFLADHKGAILAVLAAAAVVVLVIRRRRGR